MIARRWIVLVACVAGSLVLLGTTVAFATEGDEFLLLTDGITRGDDPVSRSADQTHPQVESALAQQSRVGKPPIEDSISMSASLSLCCVCPAPPAVVKLTLTQPFNYPCKPAPNPYIINRGANGTITVKGKAQGYPKNGKVRITISYPKVVPAGCGLVGPLNFPIKCCGVFCGVFQNAGGGACFNGTMKLVVLDQCLNPVGCPIFIPVHTK